MSGRVYQRWDRSQVRQHQVLVSSVLLLVLTGMPLRYADWRISQLIAAALGGARRIALLHRLGAVGLMIFLGWHVCYLIKKALQRQFRLSTLPVPKDLADAWHLGLYLIGKRRTEPRYDRYSFVEKFDYWAAVGGSCLMISTGLVLWFPSLAARLIGTTLYDLAFNLHSLEAVLAALFLLIGHVYHVHLANGIKPFNMVWWTGQMTEEEMRRLHPIDCERLQQAEAEQAAQAEQAVQAEQEQEPHEPSSAD
jgi:cytochrome b subunit of formate dehydrogenase